MKLPAKNQKLVGGEIFKQPFIIIPKKPPRNRNNTSHLARKCFEHLSSTEAAKVRGSPAERERERDSVSQNRDVKVNSGFKICSVTKTGVSKPSFNVGNMLLEETNQCEGHERKNIQHFLFERWKNTLFLRSYWWFNDGKCIKKHVFLCVTLTPNLKHCSLSGDTLSTIGICPTNRALLWKCIFVKRRSV